MADTTPTAPPAGLLRPLGFGELFDRAVTLYVRNFVPLSLIMLIVMLPYSIAQYSMSVRSLAQLGDLIKSPGAASAANPFAVYGASPGEVAFTLLLALVFLLVLPFALGAVAMGVARLYRGQAVDVRACYGRAFARFWPVLGLIGMGLLILLGTYFGLVLVMLLVFVIVAGIGQLGTAFAFVGIAIAVVMGLAVLGLLMVMAVALSFAMFAVIIEGRGVFDAIGQGFARIFSRAEFGRALLFTLAWMAISAVAIGAVYLFLFLALYLHQPWIVSLENVVVSTVIYAFSTVLLAVYYYDVRIRREGLDLETQLESLASTPPA